MKTLPTWQLSLFPITSSITLLRGKSLWVEKTTWTWNVHNTKLSLLKYRVQVCRAWIRRRMRSGRVSWRTKSFRSRMKSKWNRELSSTIYSISQLTRRLYNRINLIKRICNQRNKSKRSQSKRQKERWSTKNRRWMSKCSMMRKLWTRNSLSRVLRANTILTTKKQPVQSHSQVILLIESRLQSKMRTLWIGLLLLRIRWVRVRAYQSCKTSWYLN
jgi:hypothetical protein